MKTLSFLSVLAAAAMVAQAAPVVEPSDLSESALKSIASDRQKASLAQHNKAKAKAEKQREKDAKKAAELTEFNNAGMKKTIQRRALNTMLPPCDREPETPREPGDYTIRY
ncbi:MAG: hypothetical protein IJB33_01455 [Akkermansia sp.]|nr:hypothetical protein [Akkermansia sp.]MBQ7024944.1 hypothetical protein [Akkermansia sp.]